MRLLAAANDDAVLAAWAAVFDEHKMAPECDVSPYDCWEVLQEFLSSGVLSPLEYNSVNLKAAFFNGTRPTTGQIHDVLSRLRYLRANHSIHQEHPVSTAKPPMAAFTTQSAIVPTERARELESRPTSMLGAQGARPMISAFQQRQESFAAPLDFRAFAEPQRQADAVLPCRKVDANLYRGEGVADCQIFCCRTEIDLIPEDENIIDEDDVGDGGGYDLHEMMFHGQCKACGAMHHHSMSRPTPKVNY